MWHAVETGVGARGGGQSFINIYTMWHAEETGVGARGVKVSLTFTQCGMLKRWWRGAQFH